MQNKTGTITVDGTTAIGNPVHAKAGQMCKGTVYVQGTFGSGTVSLVISRDGQNTWIPVKDQTGSAIAFTSNGAVNYEVAFNDQTNVAAGAVAAELGLTVTGSSGASIVYYHDDER